jgi:hypothetical protein
VENAEGSFQAARLLITIGMDALFIEFGFFRVFRAISAPSRF